MDKLIELLNEYDKYRWEKRRIYWWTKWKVELDVNLIIFKKFWFIKWLVENDKVDLDKIKEIWIKHNGKMDIDGLYRFPVYERLLMLLSISDTPIEDLISYLR